MSTVKVQGPEIPVSLSSKTGTINLTESRREKPQSGEDSGMFMIFLTLKFLDQNGD